MGILDDAGRDGLAASSPPVSAPAPARVRRPLSCRPPGGASTLRRRRDALAEQVTELHWDLGGLAYEMAIRDHFRLDVLVRRAAVLQERDAELAEVERLLRMEQAASPATAPTARHRTARGRCSAGSAGRS